MKSFKIALNSKRKKNGRDQNRENKRERERT